MYVEYILAVVAQMVEHFIGNEEVGGSSPLNSLIMKMYG
jgi:hypothetical protein